MNMTMAIKAQQSETYLVAKSQIRGIGDQQHYSLNRATHPGGVQNFSQGIMVVRLHFAARHAAYCAYNVSAGGWQCGSLIVARTISLINCSRSFQTATQVFLQELSIKCC